jgi:isochorismate hydrolase
VQAAPGDPVGQKQRLSAFFGSLLQSHLTLLGCDSLSVMGGATSDGVRATAVDAFSAHDRAAVVADACFDRNQTCLVVRRMDTSTRQADIVSTDPVLAWLSRRADEIPQPPGAAAERSRPQGFVTTFPCCGERGPGRTPL